MTTPETRARLETLALETCNRVAEVVLSGEHGADDVDLWHFESSDELPCAESIILNALLRAEAERPACAECARFAADVALLDDLRASNLAGQAALRATQVDLAAAQAALAQAEQERDEARAGWNAATDRAMLAEASERER